MWSGVILFWLARICLSQTNIILSDFLNNGKTLIGTNVAGVDYFLALFPANSTSSTVIVENIVHSVASIQQQISFNYLTTNTSNTSDVTFNFNLRGQPLMDLTFSLNGLPDGVISSSSCSIIRVGASFSCTYLNGRSVSGSLTAAAVAITSAQLTNLTSVFALGGNATGLYRGSLTWTVIPEASLATLMSQTTSSLTFSYTTGPSRRVMSFFGYSLEQVQCDISCSVCSSASVCSQCASSFIPSGSACTCEFGQLSGLGVDGRPLPVCATSLVAFQTVQACSTQLSQLLLRHGFFFFANNTVAPPAVSFRLAAYDHWGWAWYGKNCTANISVAVIQTADSRTAPAASQLLLTSTYYPNILLTVSPNLSLCQSSLTSDGSSFFTVLACNLTSYIYYTYEGSSNISAKFEARYFYVLNAATSALVKRVLVPVYRQNNITTTPYLSMLACTDYYCNKTTEGTPIFHTQPIFVYLYSLDPAIIASNDPYSTSFSLDGVSMDTIYNTTYTSDFDSKRILWFYFNQSALGGNYTGTIVTTPSALVSSGNFGTQTATWPINLSTHSFGPDRRYVDSIGFVALMVYVITLFLGIVLGLLVYAFRGRNRKEVYNRLKTTKYDKAMNDRVNEIEMTEFSNPKETEFANIYNALKTGGGGRVFN